VVIDLTDANVTSGSFILRGSLQGFPGRLRAVARTFSFTLGPNGVVVAFAEELLLPARQQARIALDARARRGSRPPHLPRSPDDRVDRDRRRDRVPGGRSRALARARRGWALPGRGVIDYGPSGLSLDTLALEVS